MSSMMSNTSSRAATMPYAPPSPKRDALVFKRRIQLVMVDLKNFHKRRVVFFTIAHIEFLT